LERSFKTVALDEPHGDPNTIIRPAAENSNKKTQFSLLRIVFHCKIAIVEETKKTGEKTGRKYRISNKSIVIAKLITACVAFFAYSLFFFDNKDYFVEDFKSVRILFPLVFITGIVFIIWYIAQLVGRIESKTLWRADRFYFIYQIVFTATMLSIVCRSFFAELRTDKFVVITLILVSIATLCTPPIQDNNNEEF
jgi:hypothetical protein